MRATTTALTLLALLGAAAPLAAQLPNSENTLKLADGADSPPAEIADVAWLAGYWRGEGLDGSLEELWTPPVGDRMQGIFTLTRQGGPVFTEAMQLVEEEGSLAIRVKHFTPEFVGWEEKQDYVRFPLVRLDDNEAYFNGLTFRRRGDELLIYLVLVSKGEKTEHEMRFRRQPL